jgi:hypothetical protein
MSEETELGPSGILQHLHASEDDDFKKEIELIKKLFLEKKTKYYK